MSECADPGKTKGAGHIRVFLVDDHPPIREAISDRIHDRMSLEVCGETGRADDAFDRIEELEPDVVVVDISLTDGHGLDLIQNVQAQSPSVGIMVYSMYEEDIFAERAVRAGASGYLMKSASTEKLLEAIRSVHEGEVFLSRRMSSRILNKVAGGQTSEETFPIDALTDRELAVFQMLGEGYGIEEIQDRLNLARKTVETYRRRAKEKLNVDTVSDLLQYAFQWTSGQGTARNQGDRTPVGSEE